MATSKICLIGDIVVDVTLKDSHAALKLRMGGIVHAARCLWSMSIPFSIRYFAPEYLTTQIVTYLNSMGCNDVMKLGNVSGAPYVFLIGEARETGDQQYEFLLHEDIQIEYDEQCLKDLNNANFTDYIIISGNYDIVKISSHLNGRMHIDVANNINDTRIFQRLEKK